MAKKVSARAKRAKRRKAYYRREYIKNLAAIITSEMHYRLCYTSI